MKVGIQLFSVRENMEKDAIGTIRNVIDMGYRYLEGANHMADRDYGIGFGVKASELQKLLSDTGASMISVHVAPLGMDNVDAVIEYQKEIGTQYLVDPIAFFTCRDDVLRKAELCNKIGERCKAAGLGFLYHNHFHEFQQYGGETALDILMQNTEADLVGLELDTFWVMRGGVDPVSVMKQYGTRIPLIHQKDYAKGKEDQINALQIMLDKGITEISFDSFQHLFTDMVFAEIGTGIMDIQRIIDTAITDCHSRYIVLEQDMTSLGEFESVRLSMEQFKKFSGIEW